MKDASQDEQAAPQHVRARVPVGDPDREVAESASGVDGPESCAEYKPVCCKRVRRFLGRPMGKRRIDHLQYDHGAQIFARAVREMDHRHEDPEGQPLPFIGHGALMSDLKYPPPPEQPLDP